MIFGAINWESRMVFIFSLFIDFSDIEPIFSFLG